MPTHTFVETYDGLLGFGLDRETDEATVTVYLQKFSDDTLMEKIIPRMTDDELDDVFTLVSQLLKRHLAEDEYHSLFLEQAEGQGDK
jgi:TorA maturation chaperone TorD